MSHLLCRIVRRNTALLLEELKGDERLDLETRSRIRRAYEQNVFAEARIEEDVRLFRQEFSGHVRPKYPDDT